MPQGPRLLFFLSLFFLSALPLSAKEEFQITHRWYNFHFSSPTAEAHPPSAHPAPPPSEVKAEPGRAGQRRAPRIPRRCAPAELQIAAARGPVAAPGGPSSKRSTWQGVGEGAAAANLVRTPWGRQEGCSPARERRVQPPRAREGASARKLLRRPRGGSTGRAAGPAKQRTSGGTYLRLWLSGPKSRPAPGGAADGSGYRGWPG